MNLAATHNSTNSKNILQFFPMFTIILRLYCITKVYVSYKMSVPPAALAARTPQTELVESVRHWVHFDNLAESLNKQVANARNMRSQFEEKIMRLLEVQGMKNAVLQIGGATLQRSTRSKSTDLSWAFMEEQLHEYFKFKGKPDETTQILEFMHRHRGVKTTDYLKKTPYSAESPGKKTPSV